VKRFVDRAEIVVRGGKGGDGCISFRREKYVPLGGPDGGTGGDGGSVFFAADKSLRTLLDFRYRRTYGAQKGANGSGKNRTGKSGEDLEVRVPVGTVIVDPGTEEIIADLDEPGQSVLVARGGKGGKGNASFATPTNRSPRIKEEGKPGEERMVVLELKLLADVGMVGLPNAGKSTLLSKISAARPKIAPYPFTTLSPNLGYVQVGDRGSFVVADIPGLIEGASEGKGLGIDFLKHIERTSLLLFVIDGSSEDPAEDLRTLRSELAGYGHGLATKPGLIALNKIDLLPDGDRGVERTLLSELQEADWGERGGLDGHPHEPARELLGVSALTGEGVPELVSKLWELLGG
jgi:GTP-binding protein